MKRYHRLTTGKVINPLNNRNKSHKLLRQHQLFEKRESDEKGTLQIQELFQNKKRRQVYNFRICNSINKSSALRKKKENTKIMTLHWGLVSSNVFESKSCSMHNNFFRASGMLIE